MTESLIDWGFDDFFEAQLARKETPEQPARVTEVLGIACRVWSPEGERVIELAPQLRRQDIAKVAVGDWAVVSNAVSGSPLIVQVLERKTKLSRRAAGKEVVEQTLVANADVAWVVSAITADFNERRFERYLTLVQAGGVRPVIVLTKCDLVSDVESAERRLRLRALAPSVPVFAVSVLTMHGIHELAETCLPRTTTALLGSSGVGKSTLLNALLGYEAQAVSGVRDRDERGQHTTTSRRMFRLASGALIVDTPGMREVTVWDSAEVALAETFADIMELAAKCRFRDCKHANEPGCAVKAALDSGEIARERYDGFQKLARELDGRSQRVPPPSRRGAPRSRR